MTVFVPAIFCKKSQDYKTEREIEKLQAQINKQADEIFKKDCEISRLEEYEQRCHRSYDAWALDPERS